MGTVLGYILLAVILLFLGKVLVSSVVDIIRHFKDKKKKKECVDNDRFSNSNGDS